MRFEDDMGADAIERVQRSRAFRVALRSSDSYGLLLSLLLFGIVVQALQPETVVGAAFVGMYGLGTLMLAAHTSRASGRAQRRLFAFAALLALGAVGAAAWGTGFLPALYHAGAAIMMLVALVIVSRRLLQHPLVSTETVLGAICVYVLLGFTYSQVYQLEPAVSGAPFFTNAPEVQTFDYIYFSMVTMTTVGYGDLTAASNVGKSLGLTEAILGQVFLITAVARLVAQWGGQTTSDGGDR